MADEMTPQQPNLVEQYAKTVQDRKLEAEAQMQKLMKALDSRRNLPFDPMLMRVAGALWAPTKTGQAGESFGYAATAAADEAQRQAQQNAEFAKMEFELSEKQREQRNAADAINFRMQYFGGKPQVAAPAAPAAAPAAPAAPRLTSAPALEAQPLTAAPQMSTPEFPALLPEDMPKAPPPAAAPIAAPSAPTTYKPRFPASDLAMLGIVDKESFELATKIEEQERKTAELAAKEREARAKELEQELKQNSVNVFGTTIPFTKEQRAAIEEGIRTNDVSALDEIFMLKGIQSPYVLRDGKVKVLPQEEWTAKQKAAETLGMVKRTIRGKDYEMTAQEALEHDAAKRAGRDKYKSWVNNFFEQGSDIYTEPAPSAAPSTAAPSAAAPAKAPVKAEPPLSVGEREVEQVGKTKAVEANVAAQAKKSEELSAAVESSGERYQSATTILDLINDDKFSGAQGYFAQPGFKNAFVNFLKDGIRLGNYSLGVPALADSLQQVGMTEGEANAKATILQRSGELRMQLAAMLKGSVSNFEQVLLGNISGSVDTPLTSMRAAMSTIQAKAIFDEKNQKAFETWREKNPYASPGKYTASDEYKSVRKGYLDQVVKINNFYFPKSKVNVSSSAAGAKPEPSGGKPKSSWLPQ